MGTEPKMRTKRYLQNHVVYQRTEMILMVVRLYRRCVLMVKVHNGCILVSIVYSSAINR